MTLQSQRKLSKKKKKERVFSYLNLGLIVLSLFVMLLGPLVRAEDAGLACPDWPLCKGQLIPEMNYQIFLEWLHRLSAFILGLVFLFWLGFSFYDKELRAKHAKLALVCLALLLLQITLGAFTITESLNAYVVNLHLLNAILFLSALFYSWRRSLTFYSASKTTPKSQEDLKSTLQRPFLLRRICIFVLLLVFFQIFLGARVSTHNAGQVCNTFPACYYEASIGAEGKLEFLPQYFPPMEGNLEKHMSHRFMAYLLLLTIFLTLYLSVKKQWPKKISYPIWLLLFLVILQILVGAFNVIFHLPVMLTLLHSALAYAVYLNAFWLFLEGESAHST